MLCKFCVGWRKVAFGEKLPECVGMVRVGMADNAIHIKYNCYLFLHTAKLVIDRPSGKANFLYLSDSLLAYSAKFTLELHTIFKTSLPSWATSLQSVSCPIIFLIISSV